MKLEKEDCANLIELLKLNYDMQIKNMDSNWK